MSETIQEQGGHARAAALSPERRSEIARDAANKRWNRPEHSPPVQPVDDGVREHHGVTAWSGGTVRAWEGDGRIIIRIWDRASGVEQALTPATARYLGDQLFHLARRIERRGGK